MIFKALIALALVLGLAHGQNTISLLTNIRDFANYDSGLPQAHPDFNHFGGGVHTGIVAQTLGADDKPVYVDGQGVITSKETFDQWYNDVNGVNIDIPYTLTLTETGPGTGVYGYDSSAFFPIDNQGYGNDLPYNQDHNWGFTLEMHTVFTYEQGQTFYFRGDDDLWVFINKQLAIDLGGLHGPEAKTVNLDDLGLTEGQDYNLDLFYAERHATGSNLKIQTSIKLKPTCIPPQIYNEAKNACENCVLPQVYLDETKACGLCNAPRVYDSETFTCESCPGDEYRNFDGNCISDCPKKLQDTQDGLPICKFPCRSTQIYNMITERCRCDCKAPYTQQTVNGYQICDLIIPS